MTKTNDAWRAELEHFLDDLCVHRGYCSWGKNKDSILKEEHYTAEEFALAVMRPEGFEHPEYAMNLLRDLKRVFVERYGRAIIAATEFREPSR